MKAHCFGTASSATLLLPLLVSVCTAVAETPRPNIILCMTDDQGWGDTGYNGHPILKTPHLDEMSREGVTFNRFYSAAAMCSPTRASVYTGRHPYRMGVTFAMRGKLEENEVAITTILKEAGYRTGHFGKWHLGTLSKESGDQNRWGHYSQHPELYFCPPWERDVEVSFVTESKVPTWDPLYDPDKTAGLSERILYRNDFFTGPGEIVRENMDGDASRVVMDRAIPFIENSVKADQPFFAVIWFHTPHSPVVGGPEYLEMYADRPENEQHYYACLTAMDEQVGRLRSELRDLGVAEDTMIWFCSDNGPARQKSERHVGSTGGLSGFKLSIQEGGIRVPGLLIWPAGIPEPLAINAPCVTTDYFPTILDVLDIPLPKDRVYDGISLLPLLQGEKKHRGNPIGFLNREGAEAVWMEDRYKLVTVKKKQSETTRLYDIVTDPAERADLALEQPERAERMKEDLAHWKDGVMTELKVVYESYETESP
ncbi:MAG: sulfatase-like hydrolase/transferase [Verrucomicrobiota bacterium]